MAGRTFHLEGRTFQLEGRTFRSGQTPGLKARRSRPLRVSVRTQ